MEKEIEIIEAVYDLKDKMEFLENSMERLHDKISTVIDSVDLITQQGLYEKFQLCWDIIEERDTVMTDNRVKLLEMVKEFKGLVSMARADFRKNNTKE